jgi:hypothetical protein
MDYKDTTVIIPVKDELATEKVAMSVLKHLPNCRIIIIYKGEPHYNKVNAQVKVVEQVGSGKGVACRQAVKLVKTPIMCFIDGDATYEPKDLRKLVGLVREGADMVMGNRFESISREAMPWYVQLGNHVLTVVANTLYFMHVKDSQTGIRAMKKSVFDAMKLRETHFGIETEMVVMAKKKGFKVVEIPAHYYKRIGQSKQMKLLDGLKLLAINFKFLLR